MPDRTIARALALGATVALALSLVAGGAAAAPDKAKQHGKGVAKECAMERKAIGKAEFVAKYGKPAMPNCIGVVRNGPSAPATDNPAQQCRAQGIHPGNGNEFGKCVSDIASANAQGPKGTPPGQQ